jgi:drug/metabolite transporter (DMT)-like permease
MVQRVASVLLVLIGLYLAVIAGPAADMRLFGWVLVVVGVLGLVVATVLPRRRHDR